MMTLLSVTKHVNYVLVLTWKPRIPSGHLRQNEVNYAYVFTLHRLIGSGEF